MGNAESSTAEHEPLHKKKAADRRPVTIQWEDDPDEAVDYPEPERPSQHLKSPSLRSNIMREQKNRDPLFYYEIVQVLGVGSMGSVSKVKKKESAIGGSARIENVEMQKQNAMMEKCFDLPVLGSFAKFVVQRSGLLKNDSLTYSLRSNGSSHGSSLSLRRSGRLLETVYEIGSNRLSTHGSQHSRRSYEVYYALKSIHLDRVTDEAFIAELKNEILILKSLDHPHIVRPIETFEHNDQLFMVMELCSGGDLYSRDPYTEEEAARIVSSLLSAVAYMHEHNVVHRDLKYENILFANDSPKAEIKLIDFGLSKKYVGVDQKLSEGVGTIYTMAPEVLKGSYTSQADLWSVGVITYMLLSSQMPFFGRKRRHIVEQIMKCSVEFRGRRWKQVSEQAREFVLDLLVLDPEERATANDASRSTWLNRRYAATVRNPHEEEMDAVQESLKAFSDYSKMRRLALMVIAHKSTSQEIGILRKAFQQYDTHHRGVVSFPEFREILLPYGYSDEELGNMFDSVDMDGTGKIRYTEFLAATIEGFGNITEERLAEAFDRLDSDDTGFISAENLREILGDDLPQIDIDEIINEVDHNNSNQISYYDFLACFEDKNAEKREVLFSDLSQSMFSGSSAESLSSLSASNHPQGDGNSKSALIQVTDKSNTLARANFLEEKKLSERKFTEIKEAIGTPKLDSVVQGSLALEVT